jgi:hypothetical protein
VIKKGTAFIVIFFLYMLFISVSAFASYISARVSYFQPSDEFFKNIYGSGGCYGGEISFEIYKGLHIWGGTEYFSKKGKLTFTKEDTEIRITPFFGGLKYVFPGSTINPYIGVGVGYFQFKESNILGTVEEGEIGYLGKAGLILRLIKSLIVDVFADYSICKTQPFEIEADLGGLKAGVAIGIEF